MPQKAKTESQARTAGAQAYGQTKMFEQTMRQCEQALKTGLRLQEEASRWWTSMLSQTASQTASAQDWQKRFSNLTAMAGDVIPKTQRSMEEMLNFMEKNSRTGVDLMKKAIDAAQAPAIMESQARWMDFWESSLGTVRSNAEALTHMNSRAFDSWIEFVRRNTETVEMKMPKM